MRVLSSFCVCVVAALVTVTQGDLAATILEENVDLTIQPDGAPLTGTVNQDDMEHVEGDHERHMAEMDAGGMKSRSMGMRKLRGLLQSTPSDRNGFEINTLRNMGEELVRLYSQGETSRRRRNKKNRRRPSAIYGSRRNTLNRYYQALNIDTCPFDVIVCGDHDFAYRTPDGSCNNDIRPSQGMAKTTLRRLVTPRYDDGVGAARTYHFYTPSMKVPSARTVSLNVHLTTSNPSGRNTHLLMGYGQFLDHDITLTPSAGGEGAGPVCCVEEIAGRTDNPADTKVQGMLDERPECFSIAVEAGDPVFSTHCISFVRSSAAPNEDCSPDRRQQMNDITHYIDGSNVYGSSITKMDSLRSMKDGLLRAETKAGLEHLPYHKQNENFTNCKATDASEMCQFDAGDLRNSEQAGLSAIHTLWLRMHNYIARGISKLAMNENRRRQLDDETLFQIARKIVGALLQHITYSEFLPEILGPHLMQKWRLNPQTNGFFSDYSEQLDASVMNVFSTAAYRFGHSLVSQSFSMIDKKLETTAAADIGTMFHSVSMVNTHGVDHVLIGQMMDSSESLDRFCTHGLRDNLFNEEIDLMALNIQRGRDHGLASYNDYRRALKLPVALDFNDISSTHDADTTTALHNVYPHVEDMEIFPAGLSEKSVDGGLVGETFGNIIGMQFFRLKFGDRYWYERDDDISGFSIEQLANIRQISFASVYCMAAEVEHVTPKLFEKMTGNSEQEQNPKTHCRDIPQLDLELFVPEVKTYYSPPGHTHRRRSRVSPSARRRQQS